MASRATRPLLPQHDRATLILAYEVERVLADIDADGGDKPFDDETLIECLNRALKGRGHVRH